MTDRNKRETAELVRYVDAYGQPSDPSVFEDPYAACAMTEEEYVAAYEEWQDAYLALGHTCVRDLPVTDASCRNNNVQEVEDE